MCRTVFPQISIRSGLCFLRFSFPVLGPSVSTHFQHAFPACVSSKRFQHAFPARASSMRFQMSVSKAEMSSRCCTHVGLQQCTQRLYGIQAWRPMSEMPVGVATVVFAWSQAGLRDMMWHHRHH